MRLSWTQRNRTRYLGVYGVLTAVYLLSSWLRLEHWPDTQTYHSDSAFRYRYARMYAQSEEIPVLDRSAEFPEGLEVRKHIHLTMQALIGHSYRAAASIVQTEKGIDFADFTVYWLCFFSSLTVFGVYLVGLGLNLGRATSLLAAVFYGVSTPAFARTIGNYLPEEFVLPLLFISLGLFLLSLKDGWSRRKRMLVGSGAAVFLLLSLVSWHLTQFFYASVVGFGIFLSVVMKDNRRMLESFALLVMAGVVAGSVSSVLRAKLFLLSLPMLLSYALLVSQWLAWRYEAGRRRRLLALTAGLVASGLLATMVSGHHREFSHVYSLLFYKIRFLGSKPTDPSRLPYHARVFWVGPFSSPTPYRLVFDYLVLVLLGCWPLVKSVRTLFRRAEDYGNSSTLFWFALGTVMFLLVRRLEVFFVPFLAFYVAQLAALAWKRRIYFLFVLLMIGWGLEFQKAVRFQSRTWMTRLLKPLSRSEERFLSAYGDELERAMEWFRGRDEAEAAVLCRFDVSGPVLAYADRPVVLNPMFENYEMRERVKECWSALFEDEEALRAICEKYRVSYLLYQARSLLDDSRDSDRYTFNNLQIDGHSAIYALHFDPARLRHFELVYQSTSLRIYSVGRDGREPMTSETPPVLFDPNALVSDGELDDGKVDGVVRRMKQATAHFNLGIVYVNRGELDRAIEQFKAVLRLVPNQEKVHANLAHCFWRKGNREAALANYETAVRVDPWDLRSRTFLGILKLQTGMIEEAGNEFIQVLRLDPDDIEARLGMAEIHGGRGEFELAEKELQEVLRLQPENPHAHFRMGLIRLANGERDRAEDEFRRAVAEDPTYLKKVRRIVGDEFLKR